LREINKEYNNIIILIGVSKGGIKTVIEISSLLELSSVTA
jgi:hypothetical protein